METFGEEVSPENQGRRELIFIQSPWIRQDSSWRSRETIWFWTGRNTIQRSFGKSRLVTTVAVTSILSTNAGRSKDQRETTGPMLCWMRRSFMTVRSMTLMKKRLTCPTILQSKFCLSYLKLAVSLGQKQKFQREKWQMDRYTSNFVLNFCPLLYTVQVTDCINGCCNLMHTTQMAAPLDFILWSVSTIQKQL